MFQVGSYRLEVVDKDGFTYTEIYNDQGALIARVYEDGSGLRLTEERVPSLLWFVASSCAIYNPTLRALLLPSIINCARQRVELPA